MTDTFMGMPAYEVAEKLRQYSRYEELKQYAATMYKAMKSSMEAFEPVDPMTVAYIGKSLRDFGVVLDEVKTPDCSFEDAYFTFNAWYEGLGEAEYDGIIEWLEGIKLNDDGTCYESILGIRDRFPNSLDLLGILVLMFGDYGTSPRGGWIEHPKEAAEWLKAKQKDWTEEL